MSGRRAAQREVVRGGYERSPFKGSVKRAQVLRRLAAGDRPEDICRALGVPLRVIQHWQGGGTMRATTFIRALQSNRASIEKEKT